MAGSLMTAAARERGVPLLPVDSEHSAVFQCLEGHNRGRGPPDPAHRLGRAVPRRSKAADLAQVTVEDALNHPTWKMGAKITVDSATLMNKGLEVIEARWLFDLPPEQVQVVVHPQSIVHSMVEYVDGSVIAQLGVADMGIPILYALTYPERLPVSGGAPGSHAGRAAHLRGAGRRALPVPGPGAPGPARQAGCAPVDPERGQRDRGGRVPRRPHPLHRRSPS